MSKKKLVFASLMLVVTLVLVFVVPPNSNATTIVKSKSNISNNRMAGTLGDSPSGPWDAVVVCSSCRFAGMPEEGYLVLMDNQTGEIWAYSDEAAVGKSEPVYVGKLPAVGKRILGPQKP